MPVDRGPELLSVLGLFLALSWLFVCLRIYVKTFISKSWGADDVVLIISLIFFTTYCACSASGVHYGTGRHVADISPLDIPKALYYWWLCEIFYAITTLFIRISIAVFLLRICIKKVHKHIVYGTTLMVLVFTTFYFFLVLFQCQPYHYFWDQLEGGKGRCISSAVVPNASIAHSAVSFTADWIFGILPIALIWDLKMNNRTKTSVIVLLALGLLAGIAAMIRVPFIKVLSLTDDFLFATTDVAIWSTVEPGLGIMAFGGATLRPLFRSFYQLSTGGSQRRASTHPSNWRSSRLGYLQNKNDRKLPSSHGGRSNIELHPDVAIPPSVVTSIKSPFGQANGDDYLSSRKSSAAGMGGINVHKTVEISRVEDSDRSSVETFIQRTGTGRSNQDLV